MRDQPQPSVSPNGHPEQGAPLTSRAYYHAGPRGLTVILPPAVTKTPSCASYGAGRVCRRDRVYVTTSLEAAIGFASLVPPRGDGAVYEVVPVDPTPDPDCDMPGLSWEAVRADVVRLVPIPGKVLRKARKIMMAA